MENVTMQRIVWPDFDINSIDLLNNESKFTDDTILTIAIADCLINNKDYSKTIKEYALEYPNAGYGSRFKEWLNSEKSYFMVDKQILFNWYILICWNQIVSTIEF